MTTERPFAELTRNVSVTHDWAGKMGIDSAVIAHNKFGHIARKACDKRHTYCFGDSLKK